MYIATTILRYKHSDKFYVAKEELEKNGINLEDAEEVEIELEVEFDGGWIDDGIGPYEYWGALGNDVQRSYEVEDIDSALDEMGIDWKDELTEEELKDIIEKCEEYGKDCLCDCCDYES